MNPATLQPRSLRRDALHPFVRNRAAMGGAVFFAALILLFNRLADAVAAWLGTRIRLGTRR